METFPALLALCARNSPVTCEFPSKASEAELALMFSLICAWTNGWANNRNAVNLRLHHAHYDVTVIYTWFLVHYRINDMKTSSSKFDWAIRNRFIEFQIQIQIVSIDQFSLHLCIMNKFVRKSVAPVLNVKDRASHTCGIAFWQSRNCRLWWLINSSPPGQMAAISQTIFSDAFSWMKNFVFWIKFHWSLFLRVQLTIAQHWFR